MTRADLALVGPSGVGKTKTGKRVAAELGFQFRDTDAMVTEAHGPIDAIFAEQGEVVFREFERAAVKAALREPGVVSLGAGVVLDAETRAELGGIPVVWLHMSEELAGARLGELQDRPLLAGQDVTAWAQLAAERDPYYREVADVDFEVTSRPMSEVVDQIVYWAKSQGVLK